MTLGGKSLFPNQTLRKAGVFSTAKRLRSPTAAVFPDWHCAEARGQNHLLTLHCHLPRLQGLLSRLRIKKAELNEKATTGWKVPSRFYVKDDQLSLSALKWYWVLYLHLDHSMDHKVVCFVNTVKLRRSHILLVRWCQGHPQTPVIAPIKKPPTSNHPWFVRSAGNIWAQRFPLLT